jgi:hypothetical protein
MGRFKYPSIGSALGKNNADRRQTTDNTISADTTSTSSRHLWFSFDFSWSISCCFGTAFSHHQKGVGWWDGWF